MIRNYLLVALRNLRKHKGYAFINIFGLAVGMASTMLILMFVFDELSYDRYHKNADRIFRVTRAWVNVDGETSLHLGNVAPPFSPLLEQDFEGIIEHSVRFLNDNPLITYEERQIQEQRVFFVEDDVFEIFSWELIEGDPSTALSEPNSMVITQSTARKYFGDDNPMGKQLNYDNFAEMKVTGVAKDVPTNSHFKWDMLVSFKTIENFMGVDNLMSNWGSNNYTTYLLLTAGYDFSDLQSQLPDFLDRHQQQRDRKPSEANYLTLWPLTKIHLHSHLDSEVEPNGDIRYVYIYSIIAAFILVIACINFMNLSTARSSRRAREVGMRKVLGAQKVGLIRQFIFESVLYSALGMSLAIAIVYLALPGFNRFIERSLEFGFLQGPESILLIVGITLLVGILAGAYPAFYLSSFRPAVILKGEGKVAGRKINLRSVLVVIQFTISIALIIGVGIVQNQIDFMQNKHLGFDEENLLVLPANSGIYQNFESLKEQFESQSFIRSASISSRIPSGRLLDSQGSQAEVDGEMVNINLRIADVHIDHSFLDELGVNVAAGRNFDPFRASDSTEAFVLNEAAVRAIGWGSNQEAIGKKFNYGQRSGQIIGVVEDFHFESLHQEIAPIVFLISSGRIQSVAIRHEEGSRDQTISYLQEQWSFLLPGFPFTYYVLSDRFDSNYSNEERLNVVIKIFSSLAAVIAALGLFGLASFIAEQRIKEIAIRKVMGASLAQILYQLTIGFTILVVVAFGISAPLAYYFMGNWLGNFAYHDVIGAYPFLTGLGIALGVAWLTISIQTLKAALSNPVDSLRYE